MNDNIPIFKKDFYEVHLLENSPKGTRVLFVEAIDSDDGDNGMVVYGLEKHLNPTVDVCGSSNIHVGVEENIIEDHDVSWNVWNDHGFVGGPLFRVNSTTGEVFTVREIDREACAQHSIQVSARDRSSALSKSEIIVNIKIDDVNDSPPRLTLSHEKIFAVEENSPKETSVGHLTVVDPDLHDNVKCFIYEKVFGIKQVFSNLFQIFVRSDAESNLDREKKAEHRLNVSCVDDGDPALTSSIEVVVNIIDTNDNVPIFENGFYHKNILENYLPERELLKVNANDDDEGLNGLVQYSLSISCHSDKSFSSQRNSFDDHRYSQKFRRNYRQKTKKSKLYSHAKNSKNFLNDNDYFDNKIFNKFNSPKSKSIDNLKKYLSNHLRIEKEFGGIFVTKAFDREEMATLRFCVEAYDAGNPSKTSHVDVVIEVDDVDDEVGLFFDIIKNLSSSLIHSSIALPNHLQSKCQREIV